MVCVKVVGKVVDTTFPEDEKLALGESILEPVELCFGCFGVALFNGFVGNVVGGGVVSGDGHERLWVDHIYEICE